MGSAISRLPFGGDKSEGSAGPWIGRQPHLSPWCFPPAAHPCKQTWKIEQACGPNLVLKLNTSDGFEVAFAFDRRDGHSLGAALIAISGTATAHNYDAVCLILLQPDPSGIRAHSYSVCTTA